MRCDHSLPITYMGNAVARRIAEGARSKPAKILQVRRGVSRSIRHGDDLLPHVVWLMMPVISLVAVCLLGLSMFPVARGAMRTAPGTTTLYSSAVADGAVVTGFMFTTPLQASTCLDADAQAIAQLRDDIETSTGISNTRLVNLGIASEDGPPQVCDLNFIILPPDGPSAITTDQFRRFFGPTNAKLMSNPIMSTALQPMRTVVSAMLVKRCAGVYIEVGAPSDSCPDQQITQPQGWLSIATVIVTGLVAIGVLLIVLAVMLANRMRPFLWGAKPAVVRVEPNFGLAMPLPSNKVYDDTGRTFMYRTPEFLKKAIAGRKKQDRYQQQHSDTNVDNYPIAIMNVTS